MKKIITLSLVAALGVAAAPETGGMNFAVCGAREKWNQC